MMFIRFPTFKVSYNNNTLYYTFELLYNFLREIDCTAYSVVE